MGHWARPGRKWGLGDLGQIQTAVPALPVLFRFHWCCSETVSNFASTNPSSPIGMAATPHGLRGTLSCAAVTSYAAVDMA